MKRAILAGIVLLVLLLIVSIIRTGLAAPDPDGVNFVEFRTNAAGRLDAFYSVPLRDERRYIAIQWVQRLRGGIWTNEVHVQMERVVGDPTLVRVPLCTWWGEPPQPGEVCRVMSYVASNSWALRLRRMFRRVWPTNVPLQLYDRVRWSTNELIIPQTISSGRADHP